ncbi:hypothetical protein [Hymenobacter bucti]
MGFWNFFFGKPAKPNSADHYFEDQWFFRPNGELISLIVNGQPDSPTQWQKDFFAQLENDYSLIVTAIIPDIEDEFQNWKPAFKIVDFEREFKLVHLEISTCDQQSIAWEMSFETVHDRNHIVIVGMLGYELQYMHVYG